MTGTKSRAGAGSRRPRCCLSWRRFSAAAIAVGLLGSGCTSGGDGDAGPTPVVTTPPTSVAPPSLSPSPSPSPVEATDIEFVYEPPDSPCLPASDLTFLPAARDRTYELINSYVHALEVSGGLREGCQYELAEIGDGDDMVLDDHVQFTLHVTVFQDRPAWFRDFQALPVESDDLGVWPLGVSRPISVVWEGCGPGVACAEGEKPTVRTHVRQASFEGHIGNLEINARINYIAEGLPADVAERTAAIYRDLVLAVVDSKERVE